MDMDFLTLLSPTTACCYEGDWLKQEQTQNKNQSKYSNRYSDTTLLKHLPSLLFCNSLLFPLTETSQEPPALSTTEASPPVYRPYQARY